MRGHFNTNYSDFGYGVWLRSLSYEWRTLSGMATRVELSMQFLTGTCMHAMLVFRYMGPLPQCSMGIGLVKELHEESQKKNWQLFCTPLPRDRRKKRDSDTEILAYSMD